MAKNLPRRNWVPLSKVIADVARSSDVTTEEAVNKASQLDPYAVRPLLYEGTNAFAQENYDEAIAALSKGVELNPDFGAAYQWLAAAHALAGNEDEARSAASNVLRISPDFVGGLKSLPFVDPSLPRRLAEGLRLAGLDVPDLGREE